MSEYEQTDPVAASISTSSEDLGERPGARNEGPDVLASPDDVNDGGPGPYVMAADTLEGDDVINPEGEKLARLDKIMLDVQTGKIAYAVISSGGVLGIGDKLLAVPWRAVTLDAENECFILDVSKEQLEQAPGFDKDHWPSMADDGWAREVHTYYRAHPYYWG
jgi:sporulation protein YlmC with PRC-barrel domain